MSPGYNNTLDNQRGFGENRSLNNNKSFQDINPAARSSSSRYSSSVISQTDAACRGKDVKCVNMQLNPDWGIDLDNDNEQLTDEESLKRNIILEKSAPLEMVDPLEYKPPTNSKTSSEQFSLKCSDNMPTEIIISEVIKVDDMKVLQSQSVADEQKVVAQPLNQQTNGDIKTVDTNILMPNRLVPDSNKTISVSSDDVEMKLTSIPFGSAKLNFQNGVSRVSHKEEISNGISHKHMETNNVQNSMFLMLGSKFQIPPKGFPDGDNDLFSGLTKADMRSIALISQKFYEAFGELNNFLQALSHR